MAPTIAVGEKVRVHAVASGELRVGDVVVYEGAGEVYMLHRIVMISPSRKWFLHVGDAPTAAGPRRAELSAVVGRTKHARRYPSGSEMARLVWNGARATLRRRLQRLSLRR